MRRSLTLAAAALLFGASCGGPPPADDVDVVLRFSPQPFVGDTTCFVELIAPDGDPIEGAQVEVEGNMNHAGMVPVFAQLDERSPGQYASPFEFTMGGDWFAIVRGELSSGRSFERVVELPGVPVEPGAPCACCSGHATKDVEAVN